MSLGQLLSVGRSVSEAADQPNRYRLPVSGEIPRPGASPGRNVTMNTNSPVNDGSSEAVAEVTPVAPPPPPSATRRWPWQRNPFSSAGVSRPAGEPGAPVDRDLGQTRRAVQVELMLDQVKPVRNDLSDADLELRPLSQAVAAASRKASRNPFLEPSPERVPFWRRWWRQLSRRWLGAGRE